MGNTIAMGDRKESVRHSCLLFTTQLHVLFLKKQLSSIKTTTVMEALELINKIGRTTEIKSHLLEVIDAFQRMDYHTLSDILDDETYYQDKSKTTFIYNQRYIFKELQKLRDSYLNLSTDICTGCMCNEPIFVFTGNESGRRYAIYIEFTAGDITDIYLCSIKSHISVCLPPF